MTGRKQTGIELVLRMQAVKLEESIASYRFRQGKWERSPYADYL